MTATDKPMMKRSHTMWNATVEEVALWCIEQQLDPKDVSLAGSVGLRWESPPTKAEVAGMEKWQKEKVARQEKWERETLARLMSKYGPEYRPESRA